jgi:fructuronate reductase
MALLTTRRSRPPARLTLSTLAQAPIEIARPAYDVAALRPGIVHLGVGAFHRGHQALFTEDAIAAQGGDWGIIGVSMRKPDVAQSLSPQDGLYTVETLDREPSYRVIGAVRQVLTLPYQPGRVVSAIADPATRLVTLTITEKGYCLSGGGLDLDHPMIAHDLANPLRPSTAIGVLAAGLAARHRLRGAPLTIISCDNLMRNGQRLAEAVRAYAALSTPWLDSWLRSDVSFPETMVDCIVPASDTASRTRVERALGLVDEASVQREPFAQWIIEDRFAGPRPAWPAGVELVDSVADHRRLKLHVLNAAHSALAYLGLPKGHVYVRQAIADSELRARLDRLVLGEVAPALAGLPVQSYWADTLRRFANPMVDHRLDQIARDGAAKLAERVYPLMSANLAAGRPVEGLASVVQAWLGWTDGEGSTRSGADLARFAAALRADPRLAAAMASAAPSTPEISAYWS